MTILTTLLACLALSNEPTPALAPLPVPPPLLTAPALAGEATGQVERLLAYKNGVSLVSVRVSGTADGTGTLRYVLPPAHLVAGSVWLEGERAPLAVRAATSEEDVLRPVEGLAELLEANIGREVTLRWLPSGVTVLPEKGPISTAGVITRLVGPSFQDPRFGAPPLAPRTHVVLAPPRDADAWGRSATVLRLDDIVACSGEDLRSEIVRREVREWALEFATEPGAPFECDLHFLARGVQWRAIHRLDGDLAGEDELSLSVELSNDLIALDDTVVHVIAGEPNFRHEHLASFLSARVDATPDQNVWSQQIANPFANSLTRGRAEPSSLPDTEATAAGSTNGDLVRIPVGTLDLEVGGRMLRRVRTESVPVAHVYTLDLDVRRGSENGVEMRDARGPAENWEPAYKGGFVRSRRAKVWHQLALTNTAATPWTHGPLLVVRRDADGPFPLAQEDLRYTGSGATTEVPLNLALDVDVAFEERSLGDGGRVEGTLTVTNRTP